ncbi:MAG: thioesterase family protein [Acidobacteria bacterium]|nr:thioesterase family protein [Acidobacteriota bacterium]
MKPGFEVGLSIELTEETNESQTAPHLARPVYSTPAMVGLMERTSIAVLQPYLEEGENSVGAKICVSHIAGTVIGQKVRCKSTVESIAGRRVTFAVEAYNEKEKIGEGTHERVIIQAKRFAAQ